MGLLDFNVKYLVTYWGYWELLNWRKCMGIEPTYQCSKTIAPLGIYPNQPSPDARFCTISAALPLARRVFRPLLSFDYATLWQNWLQRRLHSYSRDGQREYKSSRWWNFTLVTKRNQPAALKPTSTEHFHGSTGVYRYGISTRPHTILSLWASPSLKNSWGTADFEKLVSRPGLDWLSKPFPPPGSLKK